MVSMYPFKWYNRARKNTITREAAQLKNLASPLQETETGSNMAAAATEKSEKLVISFIAMVFVGLGNKSE